jgi:redox-sensitive bicupin YhaK (pirin superfamily)
MIQLRKAGDRGHYNHGWLDTYHSFSFADYYDPGHMAFRSLRVINEDRVAPGQGFGMHPHRDMEIITCVLEGALEHKDSLGNGSTIRPGELQRMSAGTGIRHSEFNPSSTEWVHLYQIWLMPARAGEKPSYEQRPFPAQEQPGQLRLVASPDGANGSLTIHQDARVYLSSLAAGNDVNHTLAKGRSAWLQVLRGTIDSFDQKLSAGDGLAVSGENSIAIQAAAAADVMLFDLA